MRKLSFLLLIACIFLFAAPRASYGAYCTPTFVDASSACTTYGMVISQFLVVGESGTVINDVSPCGGFGYEDMTSTSLTVTMSQSVTYAVTLGCGGAYALDGEVWIDFNNNTTFETSESVGGYNSATNTTFNITIPPSASTGAHRMRIVVAQNASSGYYPGINPCGGYYYGDARDYNVNISTLSACSGTPTAGTAVSSAGTACSSTAFTLSLLGATTATGLVYQWQSSPDNSSWTNISGATNSTLSRSHSAATYYRCTLTCTSTGGTATSSSVLVYYVAVCYCTPVYTNSAISCASYGINISHFQVTGVSGSSINDVMACNSTGYLDRTVLYDTFAQNGTYTPSINCSGTYSMEVQVFIDFNDDGTMAGSESVGGRSNYTSGTGSFSIYIPYTNPGPHRMRVVTCHLSGGATYPGLVSCPTYSYGETRDYTVYIRALPACSGTPSGGRATASTGIACAATAFTLSDTGFSAASGLTYQWQSSPDSSSWTNISGATTLNYSLTEATATYYRLSLTCTASGSSAISGQVYVPYGGFCYCRPAFQSGPTSCSAYHFAISRVQVNGESGTSINDVLNCSTVASDSGYQDRTALTATFMQATSYTITLTPSTGTNSGFSLSNQIWIDFNDNGNFESGETVAGNAGYSDLTPFTETLAIPFTAIPGTHRMRVVQVYNASGYVYPTLNPCTYNGTARYTYGSARDYLVVITALPACSGTPSVGTVSSGSSSACPATAFTLTLTGFTVAGSLVFQWQSSPDSSTWSNISGATSTSVSTTETATRYYRCVVTCTASSTTAFSPGLRMPYLSYCYCAPAFTQATQSCSSFNFSMSQFTTAGESGSSINDVAACTGTAYQDRTSLSVTYMQGTGYLATIAPNHATTGSLTVANQAWIDFNDNGAFESGERVGGKSSYSNLLTVVDTFNMPTTAAVGSHRMRVMVTYSATGNEYPNLDPCAPAASYQYGEVRDYTVNIIVLPTCSGSPSAGTTVSSTSTACPSTPFTVSISGYTVLAGITFQWQTSPDNSTWTNVTGATSVNYTTIETTTTYFRCVVTCAASSTSSTSSSLSVPFIGYCYCTPSFSQAVLSCSTYNFGLAGFSVNGISSTSIADNATCSGTGYQNRTGLSVNLQEGSTYLSTVLPVFISTMSYTLNNTIWVDFNDNGTFETTEKVANRNNYSCNAQTIDTIVIPSGSTTGLHRMRLMQGYSALTPAYPTMNACATSYQYGEARDYSVNIIPTTCSGTPAISTVNATVSSGCTTYTSVLTLSGSSIPGIVYQWQSSADGSTYTNVSGATASSYTATVSSTIYYRCVITCSTSGGSSTTAGAMLNFGPPTVPAITGATTVCQGGTTVFSNSVSGGSWSSASASIASVTSGGLVIGTGAGSTTISYSVTNSCGTTTVTKSITVNPLPNAGTLSGASSVCSGTSTTLTPSIAGGNWSTTSASIASVNTSGVVFGVAVGTATISYSFTNSCGTSAATQSMTVNLTPTAGTISGATSVCAGSVITLTDGVSGGTWTSSNNTIATVSSTGDVTGVSGGSVNITYTVTNSCGTAIATHAVTINPLPNAGTISGSSSFCIGTPITLTTTGSGGSWSSSTPSVASVSTGGVVSGVSGGTATISYTATNSCGTVSATHPVTVNLTANAGTITGPTAVCVGSVITLSDAAAGGTWSSSVISRATINSSGDVTGLSAGAVNISYTVSGSCGTAIASYSITVNPLPNAGTISGVATVCEAATITLTNSATGGSWSTSGAGNATVSTSGVVTGITAGSDSVYYTVTNSCGTAVARKGITVNPAPIAGSISGASTVCTGLTTTLTDGAAGGTWSSSAASIASVGSTTGIVTGVTAGTANITYAVTNSCGTARAVAGMTVIASTPSAGTISGPTNVCVSTSITLTESATGGSWSTSDATVASIDATTGSVYGVAVGTATISYTVTTICGSSFTTTNVIVSLAPSAGTITGVSTFCQGASNTLADAVTGGVWSSSNVAIATVSTGGVVYGVSGGTAIISYSVTNVCGTTAATRSQTINPLPTVAAITGSNTACVGFTSALADATSGGTWTSGSPSIASVSTSGVVAGLSVGTAVITYSVSNSCGATRVTTNFTVTSGISAGTVSGSSTVCESGTTALSSTVTGGTWSSSDNTLATVGASTGIVTGVATGSLTITYTFSSTCGSTFTTYAMSVSPAPNAGTITGGGSPCPGTTITLSDAVTGGIWSSSDNSIATVDATTGVVTGVVGGTVTISYSVTNSCGTASATTSVTTNPAPSAGTVSGPTVVCVGGVANLTPTITGGTWTSSNTAIAVVSSAGVVNGAGVGTATISYAVTNACGTATTTHTVNVNTSPSAGTITGASSVCVGSNTTLSNAVSGGTWRSSNSTVATISTGGVVRGVSGGTVTISYIVITSCGSATATMSFTVNGAPSAGTISGVTTACIGTSSTLTSTVSGGTWHSSDVSVATVSASGDVTGVSNGTAVISYQVTGTCGTGTSTTSFVVNSTPTAGTVTGASTVCAGSSTLFSDAIAGGGWSSSDVSVATVDGVTGDVYGVSAGAATISYTVSGGCGTATATAAITVTAGASAGAISGASSVCTGAMTTLSESASGGTWSSSDATIASVDAATGDVYGISAGSATISYSVTSGCGTSSATAAITVDATPTAGSIFGASSVCAGATTTLTDGVSGGTWSTSDAAVASVDATTGVVTGVGAGSATISYTVSGTCGTAVATSAITTNPAPSAGSVSGPATVCVGSSVTMTDATAGGTWSSSNASVASVDATTGVVSGVSAGSTTISYAVTTGCGSAVASATITVGTGATVAAISGAASLCATAATTMTDATTGGTWSSSDVSVATISTGGVVTALAAGTTTISYSVTSSCGTVSATRTFTVNPLPGAGTITGVTAICVGSTSVLSDATTGGTWSSSNPSVASVSTSGIVAGLTAGSATITYSVSNSCGTARATAAVTVSSSASAGTLSGATTVCTGSSVTYTSSVTGGTWSSSNPSVATVSTSGAVTGVAAGSATISYSVSTSCGGATATRNITVNTGTSAGTITGTTNICTGTTTTLANATAGGTWSSNNTSVGTITSAGIVTGIAAGTTTISYTLSSSCGTVSATTTVTVNATPSAGTITGATSVCTGTSTTLSVSVTGGTWSSSNPSIVSVTSTGVVNGVSSGTAIISYTVTNASGCSASATHSVGSGTGAPTGTITPAGTVSLCGTTPIHLAISSGSAGLSVQWFRNGVAISGATASTFTATTSGAYAAIINNGCGADTIGTTNVLASPNPVISLAGASTLATGSFASYQWFLNGVAISGAVSSTYVYSTPGVYTVKVTNGAGCTVTSASFTVSGGGGTSGITEVNAIEVNVYPNPATSIVHIDASVKVNVVVVTAVGKTILEQKDAKDIDLGQYADGMYMIMVYDENNNLVKVTKLVKAQ